MIQRVKERANGSSEEVPLVREVAEGIINIDSRQNVLTSTRHIFERVRSAAYLAITPDDIQDVLPRIEKSYNSVWLTPETIAKLESGDSVDRKEFVRKTRKGVFVSGFHEKIDGQPSVAEQMLHDLTREYEPDEPTYEGRYLEDENGEILAWLTYWQPPHCESEKNAQLVREYLQKGVTRGGMRYDDLREKEIIESFAKETVMIDTIRGGIHNAARRLMAKVTQEIYERSPYVKKMIGYYLHNLYFDPPLHVKDQEEVRLSENVSSATFFASLGCRVFAKDRNPENGPRSKRILPDGRELYLRPVWEAFEGSFDTVRRNAREPWLREGLIYGDFTQDGLKEKVYRWPLRYLR
jgi:hypothetical protein